VENVLVFWKKQYSFGKQELFNNSDSSAALMMHHCELCCFCNASLSDGSFGTHCHSSCGHLKLQTKQDDVVIGLFFHVCTIEANLPGVYLLLLLLLYWQSSLVGAVSH
jgi:hypothetical protein